jgi:hypothetical protein
LESIEFNFNIISEELMQEFGLKFGQNLRQITFIGDIESNHINKYGLSPKSRKPKSRNAEKCRNPESQNFENRNPEPYWAGPQSS